MSTKKERVIVIPFPAQGHVKPLVLFSHKLAQHGFKVTFVYTEFDYNRIMSAMKNHRDYDDGNIELVSIPDGLRPEHDRVDLGDLSGAITKSFPIEIEKLIRASKEKIRCVVSDVYVGCALEVATKMGVKTAAFCPSSAALLLYILHIPKMAHHGILDVSDGSSTQKQIIQLSGNMPSISTEKFPWNIGDSTTQKITFHLCFKACQASQIPDWILCNTTHDIESSALSLNQKFLPIGPLMVNKTNNNS